LGRNLGYILGVDIGTSTVKTKLYNFEGDVAGNVSKEHRLIYPKPNWIEVDPVVIWHAVAGTIKQVVKIAEVDVVDIEGICISGMTPSCLPVDKDGRPLRPALIWCDSRAVDECNWIRSNIGIEKIHQVCGNTISPYFGGAKWLWFKRNEPQLFAETAKILQCNSYITYKLTGEVAIDFSQAGLCVPAFDLRRREWSDDMCSDLGIDIDLLPDAFSSSEIIGEVTSPLAKDLGLRRGIPVFAGGGDFACSALACGIFKVGEAGQMLGTAGNLLIPMQGGPFDPRLINTVHVTGDHLSIGNVFAGGLIRWFRDFLTTYQENRRIDYAFLDEQAAKVSPGSDGLIVLPHFIGSIAPLWNSSTKGVIFGLTPAHTVAHVYRAILEGVAYGFLNIIEIAEEAGVPIESIVAVDGGAKSRIWRQIFADVTNRRFVYYPSGGDATMGDMLLAVKGLGVIKNYDTILKRPRDVQHTAPNPKTHEGYMMYHRIYRRIYEHLINDFEDLHQLQERKE
jgi:xylulokinase